MAETPLLPRQTYTDFLTRQFYGDLIASLPHYCVSTSVANTYTATVDNGQGLTYALIPGQSYILTVTNTNTGASTLNPSSLGAKPIKIWAGGVLVDVVAGELPAGKQIDLRWDGTNFQVVGERAGSGTVGVSGTPTSGQVAEWTSATAIQGVAVIGTGSYVRATSPELITPALGAASAISITLTGVPVYTLGFGVLGVGMIAPLDVANHTVAAGKAYDHFRISQTSGADNVFTVGSGSVVSGYRSLLTLASGSDVTAALYSGAFGVTNDSAGTTKAVHAAAAGTGTSTGVLVAINAQIQPVSTSDAGSAAIQLSLTGSADDRASGINIGSAGPRFLFGIGALIAPSSYNNAVYDGWMATGSSVGANFVQLRNNAGTVIYRVDKSGNTFTQSLTGLDTTDSTSNTTGAVILAGGLGVAKNLYASGLHVPAANALLTLTGATEWLVQTVDSDGRFRLFDNTNGVAGLEIAAISGNVNIAGTVNAVGIYRANGTAGVSAGSFSTITAITSTNGIITQLTGTSDERLKDILGPFTCGLAELRMLKPIRWNWNEISGWHNEHEMISFSAQNVQAAMPEAVGLETWSDGRTWLTVNDKAILAASINSIKELADEIYALKSHIKIFEER